jgi:hypothetical protein
VHAFVKGGHQRFMHGPLKRPGANRSVDLTQFLYNAGQYVPLFRLPEEFFLTPQDNSTHSLKSRLGRTGELILFLQLINSIGKHLHISQLRQLTPGIAHLRILFSINSPQNGPSQTKKRSSLLQALPRFVNPLINRFLAISKLGDRQIELLMQAAGKSFWNRFTMPQVKFCLPDQAAAPGPVGCSTRAALLKRSSPEISSPIHSGFEMRPFRRSSSSAMVSPWFSFWYSIHFPLLLIRRNGEAGFVNQWFLTNLE